MTKHQRIILLISIFASFVVFLDGSVVNVALPSMTKELGGGLSAQQWIIDAYFITLGSLMLLAGSLSDLFGRRKILAYGLLGFGLASVLCTIAPTNTFLIVSRGLQGIAGALLVPSSLALIMAEFSGDKQGKAIGSWTAWTGIAIIIGPLLGGFLVDALSWRLVFIINIVPIAVTLWLLVRINVKEQLPERVRVDVRGALLGAIGLGGPVYALIEQPHFGWSSPVIYAPLALGLLALMMFLRHERKTPHPMMPLTLFSVRNFSVGNVTTFLVYGALAMAAFFISVFTQEFGGYSATAAGLTLLPVTIIMFFLSSKFGALAGKHGPRLFMGAGPIIIGFGFLTMLRVDASVDYWQHILPGVLLFGLGLAVTVAPLTTAILSPIEQSRAGIASAVNNAISRIAGLIAIASVGSIVGTSLNLAAFHTGIIVTAILFISGGAVSLVGIQNTKNPSGQS